MKTNFAQAVAVRMRSSIVRVALSAVLLAGTTTLVYANEGPKSPVAEAQIKYVGAVNNNELVFAVEFENKNNDVYHVVVTDQDGYVFYEVNSSDKKFFKKFVYNKAENGNAYLTFTISSGNDKQVQSFKVDTNTVENTVVTKL